MTRTDARARAAIADVFYGDSYAYVVGNDGRLYRDEEAILYALAKAGIELAGPGEVVVDAERFERVAGDAERWRKFAVTGLTPDGDFSTVQPGDLDPIAPGAATETNDAE